jgi:hypothetical protein
VSLGMGLDYVHAGHSKYRIATCSRSRLVPVPDSCAVACGRWALRSHARGGSADGCDPKGIPDRWSPPDHWRRLGRSTRLGPCFLPVPSSPSRSPPP